MTTVHIGCGAGFAGDRFDAAVPVVADLAALDGPKFLIYEVMGERTLAIAQRIRRNNPGLPGGIGKKGANPYALQNRYLTEIG